MSGLGFDLGPPCEGQDIQLDISYLPQAIAQLIVNRGVIASNRNTGNGHFLGSAGASPGDSGGGCFSAESNSINVCSGDISITGDTTLVQLYLRPPTRARIVEYLVRLSRLEVRWRLFPPHIFNNCGSMRSASSYSSTAGSFSKPDARYRQDIWLKSETENVFKGGPLVG